MVYNGKSYQNGWFGGTPIFGNTHMFPLKLHLATEGRNQSKSPVEHTLKALAINGVPSPAQ